LTSQKDGIYIPEAHGGMHMRYGWINFHNATITAGPKGDWKLGW